MATISLEIALIGMSGIDFIDLFLDISRDGLHGRYRETCEKELFPMNQDPYCNEFLFFHLVHLYVCFNAAEESSTARLKRLMYCA